MKIDDRILNVISGILSAIIISIFLLFVGSDLCFENNIGYIILCFIVSIFLLKTLLSIMKMVYKNSKDLYIEFKRKKFIKFGIDSIKYFNSLPTEIKNSIKNLEIAKKKDKNIDLYKKELNDVLFKARSKLLITKNERALLIGKYIMEDEIFTNNSTGYN